MPQFEYRGVLNEFSVHLFLSLLLDQNWDLLDTGGHLANVELAVDRIHMAARLGEERNAVGVPRWSVDQYRLFVFQILVEVLLPVVYILEPLLTSHLL